MSISNPFGALPSFLKPDDEDLGNRYMHLNGAAYGTTGLKHFLCNGRQITCFAAGMAFCSGMALAAPAGKQAATMVAETLNFTGMLVFFYFMDEWFFKKSEKKRSPIYIDKTGKDASEPEAYNAAVRFYSIAIAESAAGASFLAFISHTSGTPLYANITYLAGDCLFSTNALHKIRSGQWTVTTQKPKRQEKKETVKEKTFQTAPALT